MTVDDRLVWKFERALRERQQAANASPQPLEPSGGGGDSGGMDGLAERVTRVEVRLDGVEHRLSGIETRMDRLDGRLDKLDGRMGAVEQELKAVSGKLDLLTSQIMGKLPNWWQMILVFGAILGLPAALFGAYRALSKLGYL